MLELLSVRLLEGRAARLMQHARLQRAVRSAISGVMLIVVLSSALLVSPAATSAAPPQQGYTYEECGTIDAEALRGEIEALALDIFTTGTADIDMDGLVARVWADQGMDVIIDDAVAAAVRDVQQREGYWSRFLSGWSVDRASAFATEIAQTAFSSEAFTQALEELSVAVANELTDELATMTALAGSTALLCLQEYVGEQYSNTLYQLFEQEIAASLEDVDLTAAGSIDVSALDVHSKGLTGLSVIIVSQLVRRISVRLSREVGERVAGRIVGRVLGRLGSSLVPVAGWIVGAGLIVWDLVEGSRGALPQIEQSLTSPEIKAAVAAELAASVEEELRNELEVIAGTIANDMVEEWRLFCTRHPYLCSLPEENESFRLILDTTPVQNLTELSALVEAFMTALGRLALEDAVAAGAFEQMLEAPAFAAEIIRRGGTPDEALAWLARAQGQEAALLAVEAPLHFEPDELSDDELAGIIALADPAAAAAAAELEPDLRRALLDARPADAAAAVTTLDAAELTWLAAYAEERGIAFARVLRDVATGSATVDSLRSAATAAAVRAQATAAPATPTMPVAGQSPLASPQPADSLVARLAPVSPILFVSIGLLALLAVLGFVIRAHYGIKR